MKTRKNSQRGAAFIEVAVTVAILSVLIVKATGTLQEKHNETFRTISTAIGGSEGSLVDDDDTDNVDGGVEEGPTGSGPGGR